MTVPSLLILGTDVVLAAAPATPVQLAHACLAAGYQAVIPATWGEELIAERALKRLGAEDGPLVHCSCPKVARRLAAHGGTIVPMLLSYVSPPVATAEYLRAAYAPTKLHLTFAGGCPGGEHETIDAWLSGKELLSAFAERGITVSAQPTEFDAVLPPDRRRFYSDPGGIPSRSALRHLPIAVELHELGAENLVTDLAQRLLSGSRALLDAAPALDCCCSGAGDGVRPETARARVRNLEPPRAFAPVVDHSLPLALDSAHSIAPLTAFMTTEAEPVSGTSSSPAPVPAAIVPRLTSADPSPAPFVASAEGAPQLTPVAVEVPARRTPARLSRPVLGTIPHARTDAGRQLPRAYVARRRSTPRSVRASGLRAAEPFEAGKESTRRTRWIVIIGTISGGLVLAYLLRHLV